MVGDGGGGLGRDGGDGGHGGDSEGLDEHDVSVEVRWVEVMKRDERDEE